MDNNMRFGDYANNKMNELMETLLDVIFEFAKNEGSKAISDKLSEVIEWVNNNSEEERKIVTLWSERLAEKELVPKPYGGLSDKLLIHNFHQEGYLDGMYIGYLISMITLAENGVSKNVILDTKKDIIPKFFKKSYEDMDELRKDLEAEMKKWELESI